MKSVDPQHRLARWINAPTSGLELIHENIVHNHQGTPVGRWQISVRSYRSATGAAVNASQSAGTSAFPERSMWALTMNDNVFVLLEDLAAPYHSEVAAAAQAHTQAQAQATQSSEHGHTHAAHHQPFIGPPHYRSTFVTLSPPGALEELIDQLGAHWKPVRQSGAPPNRNQPAQRVAQGQQVTVEGAIYKIGTDWLVRAGHVILAGGALKGMLLEAEYLPLPTITSFKTPDGTSRLVTDLLLNILPNVQDAKTVAVTISGAQLEEMLWCSEGDAAEREALTNDSRDPDDDVFAYGDDHWPTAKKGDWTGIDRDKHSAVHVIGILRSEGIM
ncbi:hypothetical protein PUNSTDRAFT_63660 [Punctularia strigosozonata HHB-11173 SS5]|uniref:uncharacterized protein n=1 Tax=Punctularia strigosozonata (strain HHB-11173) TaxID=741275 RepID=UPI00044163CA|nr:uncharacterized protein PUNSTDRAFT_63660 [Punctularia strigosozonata HHB-11173 SS5]EIN10652.1 hypothetical protein PUNSTDRAFT_63660 [Punctularia strigosozonata HHB-11173 SS5]